VKGIRSFLGFCNFYRRFIPEYGRVAKPLIQLTHLGTAFEFGQECKYAFEKLRSSLVEAPILCRFEIELPTRLETDASNGVTAAVLSQLRGDDFWHPVAFISKTMDPAQLNYEIHDKESSRLSSLSDTGVLNYKDTRTRSRCTPTTTP